MDYRYSGRPEGILEDDEAVLYRALVAHATVHGCGKNSGCGARQAYEEALTKIKALRKPEITYLKEHQDAVPVRPPSVRPQASPLGHQEPVPPPSDL